MQLSEKIHRKIMKEGKEIFEMLEEYDKTREWLIGRARIDITLGRRTIKKLQEIKKKTGKPISRIIEEAIENI